MRHDGTASLGDTNSSGSSDGRDDWVGCARRAPRIRTQRSVEYERVGYVYRAERGDVDTCSLRGFDGQSGRRYRQERRLEPLALVSPLRPWLRRRGRHPPDRWLQAHPTTRGRMTDDHLPPEAQAMLQQFIEQEHGYLSWLGTTVEEFTYDAITLAVPFDEKLTNPTSPPTMHGGIAATLIDTAGGLALRPSLENPMQGGVATINLNVNYLRRAAGDMTARAEVIRAGGSVGVSQVTVTSDVPDSPGESGGDRDAERSGRSEKPVAVGQGAYRLFQG